MMMIIVCVVFLLIKCVQRTDWVDHIAQIQTSDQLLSVSQYDWISDAWMTMNVCDVRGCFPLYLTARIYDDIGDVMQSNNGRVLVLLLKRTMHTNWNERM
jgi:hypothetical protein